MTEDTKEKKRKYLRDYYAKNKATIREKQREYYLANAEYIIKCAKEYKENNSEKVREKHRKHYCTNKADYIKRADDYRTANPEKVRAYKRKHARANLAQGAQKTRKRRAAKLQRVPSWFGEFDEFVLQEAYTLAARRSSPDVLWHVDHLLPLQGLRVSGLHCGLNLQVIPALLNFRKQNRNWLVNSLEWLSHI